MSDQPSIAMTPDPTTVAAQRDRAIAENHDLRQRVAELEYAVADPFVMKSAIQGYASRQPLDLIKPAELQAHLRAISGDPHTHVRSIGTDQCLICRRDLRDDVHVRSVS